MMGLIEEEIILALQTLLAVLMVAAWRLQSPMMLPSNSGRCLSSRTVENLRQRGRPLACLRALALLLPQPPGDLDYLIHTLGSYIVGTVLPDVAEWRAPPAAWMDGAWRLDGRRTLEPNVCVLNVHRPQSLQTGTVRLHILRPHPLSNPFPMRGFSVRERAAVVAAFEFSWEHPEEPLCDVARRFGVGLSDRVPPLSARTAAFRLLVEAARCAPIALFCVCAPEPCHGDVVARMVYRAVAETAPEPLGSQSRPRRRKRPRASGTAGGEARIGPGP
jgi:hypothetical protein